MRRPLLALTSLALALPACRREAPRPSSAAASGGAAAPTVQDTAFAGTTAPLDRRRPARPGAFATLRAVATTSSPAYERIVFEFAGDSVPGYHVEYARGPVRRCGSGDPVSVAGSQRLVVRFAPARAHDDQGNPLPAQRERTLGLAAVKEMKLVCDFEGQVEWVLGVAAMAPYRASELAGPPRLVLDVGHAP